MKTPYELLGVDPAATQSQIEQGYQRRLNHYLARQGIGKPNQHTRRMQTIREAYLLLCSPQRRQAYDLQFQLRRSVKTQGGNAGNLLRAALVAMVAAMGLGVSAYWHRVQRNPSHTHEAREQPSAAALPADQEFLAPQTRIARSS